MRDNRALHPVGVAPAGIADWIGTPLNRLTLTRPDDWHLHLRDGAALTAVLPVMTTRPMLFIRLHADKPSARVPNRAERPIKDRGRKDMGLATWQQQAGNEPPLEQKSRR